MSTVKFILLYFRNQAVVFNAMASLGRGQPKNCGLILGKVKRYFVLQTSNRLWNEDCYFV
jgi:hypothetical protein